MVDARWRRAHVGRTVALAPPTPGPGSPTDASILPRTCAMEPKSTAREAASEDCPFRGGNRRPSTHLPPPVRRGARARLRRPSRGGGRDGGRLGGRSRRGHLVGAKPPRATARKSLASSSRPSSRASISRAGRADHAIHLFADHLLRHLAFGPRAPSPTSLLVFYPRAHYPSEFGSRLSRSDPVVARTKDLVPRSLASSARRQRRVVVRRGSGRDLGALDPGAIARWLPEPPVAEARADPA